MKNPIGIMQGRLSPPVNGKIQAFPWDTWEKEFFVAKEIGLDMIDWIVEGDKLFENPIVTERGIKRIKTQLAKTGISIGAVCADYFMDFPLLRCTYRELKERLDVLELLINRLNYIGITYIELPFVDNSAIKYEIELKEIIQALRPKLEKAYHLGVTLVFETSLTAERFKSFLLRLNHPAAKANYDMGNSASLGYNPREELEAYGELVATVHIKDRLLKRGSVPLGKGDTDFATCFSMLRKKNYTGPFILQAARSGDEVSSAKANILFIKKFLKG